MYRIYLLITFACLYALFGCASKQKAAITKPPAEAVKAPVATKPKPAPEQPQAPKPVVQAVKSEDGSIDGEIVGTPIPGSRFYKLKIGMTLAQVENLIGKANDTDSRVTGKQFQPFYFGGDTQRTESFYKNEGQLTFSNTNPDTAADTLIRIVINPNASGKKVVQK